MALLTISCSSSDDKNHPRNTLSVENNSQIELVESFDRVHSIDVIEIPDEVYAGDSFRVIISSKGGLLGS